VEFQGKNMAIYVGGAFAFGLAIWGTLGSTKAEEFFAGYLLEQSLSIDNLFVFILVFNYFKTPVESQSKVGVSGIARAHLQASGPQLHVSVKVRCFECPANTVCTDVGRPR